MLTDQGTNIRIIKLPETDEIKPGYSVPVDDEVDGTKRFDLSKLTTAIEEKADASEIEGLQEEIASKAGPEEIEALETQIEGKASLDDLDTLDGTVSQLDDAVSTAQGDISALQTAVEDLQIIPDTSAAYAGDFLSFDGTGLEWTGLPDMEVKVGTDLKVEENVVSVNTNGTASGEYSFVEGLNTECRGLCDHIEGVGGLVGTAGVNHVEGFQYHSYCSNGPLYNFRNLDVVKFHNTSAIDIRDGYGNNLDHGTLYDIVKNFKDRFIVSAEYQNYSNIGEVHGTGTSFFEPELYDILDVSFDSSDDTIVLTLDRPINCPENSFGSIALYGPVALYKQASTNDGLNPSIRTFDSVTFNAPLGFPGNTPDNVRPDNSFLSLQVSYTEVGESTTTTVTKNAKILDVSYDDSIRKFIVSIEPIQVPEIEGGGYNAVLYTINPASYGCNHIEGQDNVITNSSNSHAEGIGNIIVASNSHAEGSNNLARGFCSHAEGSHTISDGVNSHSCGQYTQANSDNSLVCGTYNDPNSSELFAVGNGTMFSRSTCFRIDTDGKLWFMYNSQLTDLETLAQHLEFSRIESDNSKVASSSSIDVQNNIITPISTSLSTLTINCITEGNDKPNFVVEITPTNNLTLTVTSSDSSHNNVTTLKHSVAGGNTLEANKSYQITAVGSCWILAEFEA